MGRFIKSNKDKVAYNRDYITYIRRTQDGYSKWKIVIGYAPCNDNYKEITLADDLDINEADELLDKYLLELEEEPLQEYFGYILDRSNMPDGDASIRRRKV